MIFSLRSNENGKQLQKCTLCEKKNSTKRTTLPDFLYLGRDMYVVFPSFLATSFIHSIVTSGGKHSWWNELTNRTVRAEQTELVNLMHSSGYNT